MPTIMPSPEVVAHEWEKHSPMDYIDEAAEAFHNVKIPSQWSGLTAICHTGA